jgi:hypothetical protein
MGWDGIVGRLGRVASYVALADVDGLAAKAATTELQTMAFTLALKILPSNHRLHLFTVPACRASPY